MKTERAELMPPQRQPARPIGGLLDSRFVYVPAASTDIRKTFARARAGELLNLPTLKAKIIHD